MGAIAGSSIDRACTILHRLFHGADNRFDEISGRRATEAIVLECTNMPPYADAVRAATGRPVHDLVSLLAARLAPIARSA